MMLHDRMKFAGAMVGVVFAVLPSNQQAATFLGLLDRNLMFVERAGADVWILPGETENLRRHIRWSKWLSIAALAALGALLVRNVSAGPANLARTADLRKAAREVPAPGGRDDREPLGAPGYVTGNGLVEPADREIKAAGRASGRVARILVDERATVRRGQELMELESDDEKAALGAAEADLAVAATTLERTRAGLRQEDVEALVAEAAAAEARARLSAEVRVRVEQLARTDDPVEWIDVKILEVVLQLDASEKLVPGTRVTSYVEDALEENEP